MSVKSAVLVMGNGESGIGNRESGKLLPHLPLLPAPSSRPTEIVLLNVYKCVGIARVLL